MPGQGPFQCPICYDVIKKPAILRSCGHAFCYDCIDRWFSAQTNGLTCPFCRDSVASKKRGMIKIRPKYDHFEIPNDSNGSQKVSNLEALREQLAFKTNEIEKLRADEQAYEQQQEKKFEMLNKQIDEISCNLQPLKDKLGEMQRKVTHTLASMPHIVPFFDRVYSEVSKNSWSLKETESYDNILTAWESARGQSESRHQMRVNLENIKKQIVTLQKRNLTSRSVCNQFQVDEFCRRLSDETFERLCKTMNWDYQKLKNKAKLNGHDTQSLTPFGRTISSTNPPLISDSRKRPALLSSDLGASSKIAKKTISFFDHNLLDLDDDGDSI